MRDAIQVGAPRREGSTRFVVPIAGTGRATDFVRDDLWVECDVSLDEVSDGVLVLPALMSLLPLAWLEDFVVEVAVADESFVAGVPALKEAWRDILWGPPTLGGTLLVETVDRVDAAAVPDRALCLFTGGVDSTATAVRHRDEELVLMTVWGADGSDPSLERPWGRLRELVGDFARTIGCETSFVRSNYRLFIDSKRITRLHPEPFPYWWRGVHGMVHLALAAPIAVAEGAETVYIASGRIPDFEAAPGSLPSVDNLVRFGSVAVVHDGFGLPRPDKQRLIAQEVSGAPLNVCYTGSIRGGSNCRRCEKCIRTMITFVAIGVDPALHGLAPRRGAFRRLRRALESGRFDLLNGNQLGFWMGVQAALPEQPETGSPQADEFLRWFAGADVAALRARAVDRPDRWRAVRARFVRLVPHKLLPLARRAYLAIFRRW